MDTTPRIRSGRAPHRRSVRPTQPRLSRPCVRSPAVNVLRVQQWPESEFRWLLPQPIHEADEHSGEPDDSRSRNLPISEATNSDVDKQLCKSGDRWPVVPVVGRCRGGLSIHSLLTYLSGRDPRRAECVNTRNFPAGVVLLNQSRPASTRNENLPGVCGGRN